MIILLNDNNQSIVVAIQVINTNDNSNKLFLLHIKTKH